MAESNFSLQKTLTMLLDEKKYHSLRDILSTMNPADIAAIFDDLDQARLPLLFRLLPKELAAETFVEMEPEAQELLIQGFSDSELKEVIDELYVDDAVDIVEEMPAGVVKRILKHADPDTRKSINEILKYPEDSAGSIMNMEFLSLKKDMTVEDAFKRIRRIGGELETINILYVTDPTRHLQGVLSVRDLLLADEDDRIEDIMDPNVVSVMTLDDKEDVAQAMSKYDYLAMPVVDQENRLIGIVTVDDAMDVMVDEATEDITKMAAINPSEKTYFETSVLQHAKNRIPWLLILMFTSIITGTIITRYENAFAAIPLLVSFIPMLMDTGGNCGSQSATLIIRGIALDEIHFKDLFKVVFKEFRISLIVGAALSIVNGLRILIQYRNPSLALVIAFSLIGTVIMAKMVGCMLPLLAKKVHLDPAIMASPLITTLVDTFSILIYFNIATLLFKL